MRTKMIPPMLMLFAGAITSIITFKMHYEMKDLLIVLLTVLLVFYTLGCLIKKMLDSFEKANVEEKSDEGEVIAKQLEDEENPNEEESSKGQNNQ